MSSIVSRPGDDTRRTSNREIVVIEPRIKEPKTERDRVITKWLKLHNLRQVQYLAGHKSISSTEEYLQNEMEGLQEEINKYHPLG